MFGIRSPDSSIPLEYPYVFYELNGLCRGSELVAGVGGEWSENRPTSYLVKQFLSNFIKSSLPVRDQCLSLQRRYLSNAVNLSALC